MATFPKKSEDTEAKLTLTQSELDAKIAEAVKKATKEAPSDVASAVAQAMREVIPATALALQQAQATNGAVNNMALAQARLKKLDKCSICGQVVGACGGAWATRAAVEKATHMPEKLREAILATGKFNDQGFLVNSEGQRVEVYELNHVRMVVFPKDSTNERWFAGVIINGRRYLSNGPQHAIWVPKENNIAALLNDFEEGERRARTPRTSLRNSGSVSGNGGMNYNPASFND